jgi:hypothetical protein
VTARITAKTQRPTLARLVFGERREAIEFDIRRMQSLRIWVMDRRER